MTLSKFPKFLIAILIPQLAGVVGSFFTISSVSTWYTTLNKPAFNPPSWIFGTVWTMLYFLMGVALYFIWTSNSKNRKVAIELFSIQLVLNALWSIIFFGLKSPGYALLELTILFIAIILTTWQFWKIDKKAGALLTPYLLWSGFALILNYSIWILNT